MDDQVATHAAMINRAHCKIGRIVAPLKRMNALDDMLICSLGISVLPVEHATCAPRLSLDNCHLRARESMLIEGMGIEEISIAKHGLWRNLPVERMIGTIRREYLDHVIVLSDRHLKSLPAGCFDYYHQARPHQSLTDNAPMPRDLESPEHGPIVCTPPVGGLHHRYGRRAA